MAAAFTWCAARGKWHQLLPPAAATKEAAAEQPSQRVHEAPAAVTPQGKHIAVTMSRVSTGGTRHEAVFKREKRKGAMSGAERKQKAKIRLSLFPDKQIVARRKDAERKGTERSERLPAVPEHDEEPDESDEDESDIFAKSTSEDSEIDRLIGDMPLIPHGSSDVAGDEEYDKLMHRVGVLRGRRVALRLAARCDCSVLTEWGECKRPECFDWDSVPPAPRAGGGRRIRCHTCGTVRCSANCGLLIFNCCEHDNANWDPDITIGAEIRDAAEELFDASPDRSCTLQELRTFLIQRGQYGRLQVPSLKQRQCGDHDPCTGGRYFVHLKHLRLILQPDTGAGCFPPSHPDSKLHKYGSAFFQKFMLDGDVLHRI